MADLGHGRRRQSRLFRDRRRHLLVAIVAGDAFHERTLGRLAGHDRLLDRALPQVQAQIGLSLRGVRPVTGKARLGQDGADVAAVAQRWFRGVHRSLDSLEPDHVVVLEKLLLTLEPESGGFDLAAENFLPGAHVLETPIRGLALLAAVIDHHQPAARLQGGVERGHRLLRKLEVVVRVAEENHVDRAWRQFARINFAEHRLDVLDPHLLAGRLNVLEKVGGDVGRIDRSRPAPPQRQTGA